MKEYQNFAQQIGLIGITNILVGLSTFLLIPVLTKNLPIEDYGQWVQLTVTISLFPLVVMLGLPYTMVRFLAVEKSKEEMREGFYSMLFIIIISALIFSSIFWFFSDVIADFLFGGNTEIIPYLIIILFLECIIIAYLNIFRTFRAIKKYSIILLFKTYLGLFISIILVQLNYGLKGAILGILVSDLLSCLIMCSLVFLKIGFFIPKFTNIREYLSFGLPTVPSNISSWIVNSSAYYIIGILLGVSFVGYYGPGYSIGSIILMIVNPIGFLLPAVLSKFYDENKVEDVKTILDYSLKYFFALAIPSAIGLALLSKPILLLLSTPEIANNAYLIVPFISAGAVFFGLYTILIQIFVLEKRTIIFSKIWFFGAILNIVLNFLFIPLFGITGAAIANMCVYASILAIVYYFSEKILHFNYNASFIIKCCISSASIFLIIAIMSPQSLLSLLLSIILSSISYFTVLILMRGFSKEEIVFFTQLFRA